MGERRRILVAEWQSNKNTMSIERLKELKLEIIQMLDEEDVTDITGLLMVGALFLGEIEAQIKSLDHPKGDHWWNR